MALLNRKRSDFSVIIPTYNRASYLRLAIFSVLRQKDVSVEIIVSDDCSNDNTEEMVKSFHEKRIKYIKNNTRLGTSHNMQKCFLRAKGEYIFTLGDDDLILDEYTLIEIRKMMKKYNVGIGRIGAIGYEKTITDPYQAFILSDMLLVIKPKHVKNILTISSDFGLGYFSGLVFDNNFLNRDFLKLDHTCYPDHMCLSYYRASYDLIIRHGIAYLPDHFVVGRLSLDLIPRYFDMEKHGRLYIEEPIIIAKPFMQAKRFEDYKRVYLRKNLVMLPNIKYFSSNKNLIKVVTRIIRLDNTILIDPRFIMWTAAGLMPKFIIKFLRFIKILVSRNRIREITYKYDYLINIHQITNNFDFAI